MSTEVMDQFHGMRVATVSRVSGTRNCSPASVKPSKALSCTREPLPAREAERRLFFTGDRGEVGGIEGDGGTHGRGWARIQNHTQVCMMMKERRAQDCGVGGGCEEANGRVGGRVVERMRGWTEGEVDTGESPVSRAWELRQVPLLTHGIA